MEHTYKIRLIKGNTECQEVLSAVKKIKPCEDTGRDDVVCAGNCVQERSLW